ncbi:MULTISPECIES: hypothetical protein [unclassified Streptomyces]|uniref:hypothetical protein n=1 Tax=unclassified Streptomyces TaxID=2593676 RepID=UPI0035D52E78
MGGTAVRILGAATAAYSAAIIIRPVWLARPCGLISADGAVPASTGLLIRAIGARDVAIGIAMLTAGDPPARRTATACRVAADWSDAALFGTLLPDTERRLKVAGFAAAWGALCAVAAGDTFR